MFGEDGRYRMPLGKLLVAQAAGAAAVAGSYAGAGFTPEFVVAPISDLVVALTPGVVVTWAIQTLGSFGQQLSLLLALALTVGLFALATLAAVLLADRFSVPAAPVTALAGLAVALALTGAFLSSVAAGVAAAVVVAISRVGTGRADAADGSSAARRRVLQAFASAFAVGGVGAVLGDRRTVSAVTGDRVASVPEGEPAGIETDADADAQGLLDDAAAKSLDVSGLEGLVSDQFYQVDINSVNPVVDAEEWSLRLTGAVAEERTFDYDDLTSLDAERRFVTLRCVGEGLNGKKMDTALWTGVPVTDLLDWDELPEQCCVMVRAVDDYFEEFPLAALEDAFLAYGMNGESLPRGHGHPVRLLVPGHWGEINVKWVSEIEVLEQKANGYWEKRGWHGTGPVETVAKLHAVNHLDGNRVQIGGHAYAGTRGIRKVEVSTDGGDSWREATLSDPLPGTDVWRQWEHTYEADGAHEAVVRATDGTGTLQPREQSKPFPSGPTGWVSKRIEP